MIPQIASALSRGFSSKQVIDFILKKFPEHSDKIKSALSGGFTVDQVLKSLSGNKDQRQTQQRTEPTTEFQQTRQRDIGRREEIDKNALKTGALAATSLAAPMAASALKRALPTTLESTIPNVIGQSLPQTQQQPPSNPPINTDNLINPEAASIPEPSNIQQPEVIFSPKEYLEKAGILPDVDRMLKEKNTPEAIAAVLGLKQTKGKAQAKIDPDLLRNIEEYAKTAPIEAQEQLGQTSQPQLQEAEPLQEPIEQTEVKEEAPKIEKNSVVSSPDGLGTVKEIRNGKALVEIDGKLTKVNEEDLEPPLYSDDDIADAYDRLMAVIPEKERSGFISWAGYDENTNELGFIPRGGKYEVITDISPEEAKMIKEGTGTARTNGEVREGLWVAGGETRGGVISQIIWDRRKKKEAEEKKQGKFAFDLPKPEKEDRGMKPQFDEMAYARNLSRARDKRAKDEERARKKKEKDEAKKRKK